MILEVKEDDNGELYVEFPDDFMEQLDWNAGDVLQWINNQDGTWTLEKKVTDDNSLND